VGFCLCGAVFVLPSACWPLCVAPFVLRALRRVLCDAAANKNPSPQQPARDFCLGLLLEKLLLRVLLPVYAVALQLVVKSLAWDAKGFQRGLDVALVFLERVADELRFEAFHPLRQAL